MVGTSDTYASSEASSAVKSDKRNASYMNSSGHIPLKTSNHPPPSAVASVSPYGLTRPPAGPPNPGMISPQLKRSEAPYFPVASAGDCASSTGSAHSHEPFHHNMRWNPHYPPPQQMHPRHFHPQHHPRARPPFYPPQQQQEMPLLERKKIVEEILLRQRELDSCWQEDEFDCPRDFTAIDRKKEFYAESSDEPYAAREQTLENDDHIGKSVSNENLCFSPPWVEEKNKSHQFAPTYERKTQGSATSNQLTATSRGYHQAPLPPSSRTKAQAVVPPIPRKKVNINNIVRHISYTDEPEVPQNLASIWPQSEMGSRIPSSERIAYSPLCMSALPSGAQTPVEEEVEEKAASEVSSSASKSSSHASSDMSQHKDQQIGYVIQQQRNQIQQQNLIQHQNKQQQNQNQQKNLSQQQNQIQQNQSQNSEPTEQHKQQQHADPLEMYKESSQFKQAYTMLPPQVDVVKTFRDGSELGSRIPSCEQINLSPLTMSGLTSGVQTPLEPNTGAIPLASLANQNNVSTERLVSTTERPESPLSVYSESSIDSNESGAAEKLIARAQCSSTPPLRDDVEQHDYIQNFSTFEQSELSSRIPSCERIPLSPLCQSELPSGCQTPEEVEVTTTTEPPSDEPPSSAAADVVMRPKKASKLEEIMAKMNMEGGPPRLDDYQNDSVKIFGQSEHSSRMQSRDNLYFTPPWSASTSGLVTPCNGAVVNPTVQKIVEEDNENNPNGPVPVENYSAQKPAPPQQQRRDSISSEESTFSNHTDISTVVNAPMSMHNTAPASPIPDGSEESDVSCEEPLNDLSECYSRTGSPTGGANQSSINQFNQQQLQWYKQHQQQQQPPHPAALNQNNMVQRSLSDQRRTHEEHDQRHVDQSVKEKFCRINDHDSITDQFNQIRINNANPPPPHPIQHQPPHSHLSNIHHRPPHHPPFSQPHPPYFNQNTYPRFPHHHLAGNFAQPPHSTRPPHQMVSRPPFHAQRLMAPNMHPRHESVPPRPFFQHFSPQQHKPEYEQPSDFADYPNDFEDEAVFPNQRVTLKRMQTIPEANQQRHPRFPPKHQPFPPHKPYNIPPDIRGERSYSVTSLEPNRDSPPRDSDTTDNVSLVSFASQAATNQNMDTKADMMTSLLSMLGTHEPDEMARTLLAISRSPDSCVAMRQSGYLPIIVDLLHHHDNGKINWGTRQRAARALHNIVHLNSNDRRGKREVRVLGWLESIRCYSETVLADGDENYRPQLPDHLREHGPGPAVAAVMKLSFEEEHKNTICELGGLQTVGELLVVDYMTNSHCRDNYAIFLRKYAGMVLINLTYNDSSNKTILSMLPKTMNAIVAQLRTPGEEDLVQVFAGIIRNVSWRPDQNTQHSLQEANAVRALMTCIQKLHSEVCIRAVLSAVWNLSAHSSENKEEICRTPGSLTYLAYALSFQSESQNFSVQENAGGILRNISSHIAVSNEYRRLIRQGGCMQTLVAQLRSPSTRVVSNSTGILWNLSARCVDDQNLLWELGAVSVLKNLVNSKHKSISASSAAALRNLLAVKPGSGTDTETVTSFQHRTNSLPHRNKAGQFGPKNKSMRGKQKEKPKAYIDNSSESGLSHTPPPVMYPKVLERYEGASEQSSMLYFPRHHRNYLPNPVPEKVSSWIDKCSREKLIVDAYEDAPQSVCADTIRGYPPPTPKFTPKSKRRPLTPRLGLKSRKQKSSTDTVRSSKETLNTDEKGVWMKNFKQKIFRKSYSSDIDKLANAGAEKKSFFEIYNM